MVDFTQYQPPGVYVQDTSSPLVATTGVPATVVCLIGAALGYQTYTEVVTLSNTTPVQLNKRGIWLSASASGVGNITHTSASIAAPVVTNLSTGVALTEGSSADYTMQYDSSGANGVTSNGISKITAVGSGNNGLSVVITYRYTAPTYFAPNLFTDYDNVVATYGQPLVLGGNNLSTAQLNAYANLSSQVTTPLTLGAKVAFENGANQVICVALDPSAGTLQQQFQAAYGKISSDNRINLVVPLFVELTETSASTQVSNVSNLVGDLVNALNTADNNGIGRIGIFGTSKNLGTGGSDGGITHTDDYTTLAGAANSKRVIMAYPHQLNYFNAALNQTTTVDGAYLAAAYAGRFSAVAINKALTRETIRSFQGIPGPIANVNTRTFKNTLSRAGVAVAEMNTQNVMWCRHGVSTAPGNLITREPSLTRQRDALFTLVQTGLESADLVGQPIVGDTDLAVKGVVAGILESAVSNGVIVNYSNLLVRQQALPGGDPTAIEVKFAYQPAVPLNYVIATFSLDLTSGLASATDTTS